MKFYDKEGQIIDLLTWSKLCEDLSYRRIAEDILPDGKWISTVWLGLAHHLQEEGPPLIFETMVFPSKENLPDIDCRRYSTLEEAQRGHKAKKREMVEKWSKETKS